MSVGLLLGLLCGLLFVTILLGFDLACLVALGLVLLVCFVVVFRLGWC